LRYWSCWLIFIISWIAGPTVPSDTVTAQELSASPVVADSTVQDSSRTQLADPWLGADKFKHIALSAYLVGAQMYIYQQHGGLEQNQALSIAIAGAALAGVGKEIYDGVSGRGRASWKDLFADFLGIALGSLIFTLD